MSSHRFSGTLFAFRICKISISRPVCPQSRRSYFVFSGSELGRHQAVDQSASFPVDQVLLRGGLLAYQFRAH